MASERLSTMSTAGSTAGRRMRRSTKLVLAAGTGIGVALSGCGTAPSSVRFENVDGSSLIEPTVPTVPTITVTTQTTTPQTSERTITPLPTDLLADAPTPTPTATGGLLHRDMSNPDALDMCTAKARVYTEDELRAIKADVVALAVGGDGAVCAARTRTAFQATGNPDYDEFGLSDGVAAWSAMRGENSEVAYFFAKDSAGRDAQLVSPGGREENPASPTSPIAASQLVEAGPDTPSGQLAGRIGVGPVGSTTKQSGEFPLTMSSREICLNGPASSPDSLCIAVR